MIERQKRLIEVYEYLRRYFGIHTKTGFAEALQYGRTSMSAALNGDESYLTDKLFKTICEKYPGVFSLDYLLTGQGELLTHEEDARASMIDEDHQPSITEQAANIIDLYAGLIKEIESLRAQLKSELEALRKERLEAADMTVMLQECLTRAKTLSKQNDLGVLIASDSRDDR